MNIIWNETDVHVMVDLETLGLQQNAIVLSVGAVVFDPTHQDRGIGDEYYVEIDPEKYNGSVDLSTVKFWMEQGNCPMGGKKEGRFLGESFSAWLDSKCGGRREKLVMWANGIDFDIPKLQYAYIKLGRREVPWKYHAVRDARTVYKLLDPYGSYKPPEVDKHNALADARYQANWLINIFHSAYPRKVPVPNVATPHHPV